MSCILEEHQDSSFRKGKLETKRFCRFCCQQWKWEIYKFADSEGNTLGSESNQSRYFQMRMKTTWQKKPKHIQQVHPMQQFMVQSSTSRTSRNESMQLYQRDAGAKLNQPYLVAGLMLYCSFWSTRGSPRTTALCHLAASWTSPSTEWHCAVFLLPWHQDGPPNPHSVQGGDKATQARTTQVSHLQRFGPKKNFKVGKTLVGV